MTPFQHFGRRAAALIAVCLGASASIGCSDGRPTRVPVSGVVLIDGKPLTSGYVNVVPDKARPGGGEIDKDGRFKLTTFDGDDGCVLGEHKVYVVATQAIGNRGVRWLAPKKYSDAAQSGLTVKVDGPRNDVKLELTWAGGKPFEEYFQE